MSDISPLPMEKKRMTLVDNANTRRRAEHVILSLSPSIPTGMAERALLRLKGVKEVSINHFARTVHATYDATKTSSDKIRALLKKLG
jgi:hypothetical protein